MTLYKYSEAAQIGITVAFAFLVIADLIGNSIVCIVVLRNRYDEVLYKKWCLSGFLLPANLFYERDIHEYKFDF